MGAFSFWQVRPKKMPSDLLSKSGHFQGFSGFFSPEFFICDNFS